LDTAVIVDCVRGRKATVDLLTKIASEGSLSVFGCCAVDIAEAILNNLTLVTDNIKHYPMPELNTKQIRPFNNKPNIYC